MVPRYSRFWYLRDILRTQPPRITRPACTTMWFRNNRHTCTLYLMQVLLVGVEGETEVEELEAAVVGAPHQVGRLQVGVDV